jgi:hypothetical protein
MNRKILLFILLLVMLFLLSKATKINSQNPDYTIEGDRVYINDSNVYLVAYPHTITSSGWVHFNLTSKIYSGNVDAVWGFNTSEVRPTKAELFKPEYYNITHYYTCECEAFNITNTTFYTACWFNYTINPKHFWCWKNETNTTSNMVTPVLVFDHSFEAASLAENTAWWNTTHLKLWKDITNKFNSINYDFGGMNKWWYVTNVPIVANTSYFLRAWVEVPPSDSLNGKYWFAIKKSSQTIQQAIQSGNFYYIDPWFNSNWTYRKDFNITNHNATEILEEGYTINLTFNHSGLVATNKSNANGTDVRIVWGNFSASTAIELDRINITPFNRSNTTIIFSLPIDIPAGATDGNFSLYYGNEAAGQPPENKSKISDTSTAFYVFENREVKDMAGNNDGILVGTPEFSSGRRGEGLELNGTNYVKLNNSEADLNFSIYDNITIEAWIYPKMNASQGIFTKYDVGANKGLIFSMGSKNELLFILRESDTVNEIKVGSNITIPTFQWTHVAVKYNGTRNATDVVFYVNGIKTTDNIITYNTLTQEIPNNPEPQIGSNGGIQNFNGTIDSMYISRNRTFKLHYHNPEPTTSLSSENIQSVETVIVTLISPENSTNTTDTTPTISFNISMNEGVIVEANLIFQNSTDTIIVGSNSSVTNATTTNLTVNITLVDDTYEWFINITINETATNQSEKRSILIDSTKPTISNLNPQDNSVLYSGSSQTHIFDADVTDNNHVHTVIFEFDGFNETATFKSGNTYRVTKTGIGVGSYQFRWYANDTTGNIQASSTFTYSIIDPSGQAGGGGGGGGGGRPPICGNNLCEFPEDVSSCPQDCRNLTFSLSAEGFTLPGFPGGQIVCLGELDGCSIEIINNNDFDLEVDAEIRRNVDSSFEWAVISFEGEELKKITVTVPPKSRVPVKIKTIIPENTPFGSYRFDIIFSSSSASITFPFVIQVSQRFGLTIAISSIAQSISTVLFYNLLPFPEPKFGMKGIMVWHILLLIITIVGVWLIWRR